MAKKKFYVDIDLNRQELKNVSIEKLAAHPTGLDLYEGRFWGLTTDNHVYHYLGSSIRKVPNIDDLNKFGELVGSLDATTGIPTTGSGIDSEGNALAGTASIQKGDYWRISVGGTIVGIDGDDVLNIGDILIALQDNATLASHFLGVQQNIDDSLLNNNIYNIDGSIPAATFRTVTIADDSSILFTSPTYGNILNISGTGSITAFGSGVKSTTLDADNNQIIFAKPGIGTRYGYLVAGHSVDQTWTLPNATGTVALLSDIVSIYSSNGTIGAGRIATLTDTLTFTGGNISISGSTSGLALTVKSNHVLWGQPFIEFYNGNTTDNSYGAIKFNNNQWGAVINMNNEVGVEKIRLSATTNNSSFFAGFLSIGTTVAPGASLRVHAYSTGTDKALLIRNSANTLDLFKVQGDGRVAIGNLTATSLLHIKGEGATSATTSVHITNSAGTSVLRVRDDKIVLFGDGITVAGISNVTISDSSPFSVGHSIHMTATSANVYGTKITYGSGVGGTGGNVYGHHLTLGGADANNTGYYVRVYDYVGSARTHIAVRGEAYRNANGAGGTSTLIAGKFEVGLLSDRSATNATALDAIINMGGSAGTITNATGLKVAMSNFAAGDTITNLVGIDIDVSGAGTTTTRYSMKLAGGNVNIQNLPTSSAGLSTGDIWNNSGVLTIV